MAYQAGRLLGDGGAVLGGTLETLRGFTTIAGGGITAMAGVGLAVGGSETMILSPVGAAVTAAGAAEIGAGAALTAQGLMTTGRAVAQGIQDGRILMAQADPGSGTGSSVSEGTGNTEATQHGAQRIQQRGFGQQQIDNVVNNYSQKVYQPGGRTVYAKKVGNFYDVVIKNSDGKIITTVGGNTKSLRNWKDVVKMLQNNGGYSTIPID